MSFAVVVTNLNKWTRAGVGGGYTCRDHLSYYSYKWGPLVPNCILMKLVRKGSRFSIKAALINLVSP